MRGSPSSASCLILNKKAPNNHSDLAAETRTVALVSLLLAFLALGYSYQHGLLLLYGDAVAHLHIARRVFDSLNPGFRQLGSVWLPLPHILLIPFVQKMEWWQNGLAGAWPSMGCYVLSCVGFYRLCRLWLSPRPAVVSLAFFALNPGLLYLQTTAMTEPLFLAEIIWSTYLLAKVSRMMDVEVTAAGQRGLCIRLLVVGLLLVAAVFTRYDGWIYSCFAWLLIAAKMRHRRRWKQPVGGAFLLFTVLVAAAPALWMAYNAKQFGDPLDFMRGPYSAKAIEARTAPPGAPHYPGYHHMGVAGLYFLKSAELNVVPKDFANYIFAIALVGTALALIGRRGLAIGTSLLLWIPLPFYAYSVAYGSVPIFIPTWWPFSWYNTRYGIELLPAFALFLGFVAAALFAVVQVKVPRLLWLVSLVLLLLVVGNSVLLFQQKPLVLQEAFANSRSRIPFESALARSLMRLPSDGDILIYTSEHIGALQQAGIPLKRTINETDYYQFPPAIAAPARSAAWVVGIGDDAVAKAVKQHPENLELIDIICSTGQPCARIYRSNTPPSMLPSVRW
jgi:hypothetical protein